MNWISSLSKTALDISNDAVKLGQSITNQIFDPLDKANREFLESERLSNASVSNNTDTSYDNQYALPWIGAENEASLKEQILALSQDERTFLTDPLTNAPESSIAMDKRIYEMAKDALRYDPRLGEVRFRLVPSRVSEDRFWRNYFYRVGLLAGSPVLKQTDTLNVQKNHLELRDNEEKTDDGWIDEIENNLVGKIDDTIQELTESSEWETELKKELDSL